MAKNIEKINIMSVYYNSSLKRNIRESRIILNKNKKRYNFENLRYSLKQMISEKENKLKALNESIKIKNSKNKNNPNKNSENYIYDDDIENNEKLKNKINNEEDLFSLNNNITNKNDIQSSDYKIPLLVNIGLEIDELANLDLSEDNIQKDNENVNNMLSKIEEENNIEENEID